MLSVCVQGVCFRLCAVRWTSLKNSHMQPLQRTINAVRNFLAEFLVFSADVVVMGLAYLNVV